MTLYRLNVTVHLLAALLWLGGMLFLAAVAPVLRRVEPAALRADLFRQLGERFRTVGWASIAVLLVTGYLNLRLRGLGGWDVLGDPSFWSGAFGRSLAWKLVLVAGMLIVAAVHDFVLGPRASRVAAGTPEALRYRRAALWGARINALLGIVLVYVAVALARGG